MSAVMVITQRLVPWATCCGRPRAVRIGVRTTPPPAPMREPRVEEARPIKKVIGCGKAFRDVDDVREDGMGAPGSGIGD